MLAQSLHLNNSGPGWFQQILHEAIFISSCARHWSNIVQIQSIRNFSKLWSFLTSSNHMLSLGANNYDYIVVMVRIGEKKILLFFLRRRCIWTTYDSYLFNIDVV